MTHYKTRKQRKECEAMKLDKTGNVTTNSNGERTSVPQAKVIAGAVTGISLAIILGMVQAVTPDHLSFLGQWGSVVYGGVVALGSAIAAYLKRPSDNAS